MLKICKDCSQEFQVHYHLSYCKTCFGKRCAHSARAKRVGLTFQELTQRVQQHNQLCEICHQPESVKGRTGKIRQLTADHNAQTIQFRGFLCHSCNVLLGHAKDSITILESAILYLQQHS